VVCLNVIMNPRKGRSWPENGPKRHGRKNNMDTICFIRCEFNVIECKIRQNRFSESHSTLIVSRQKEVRIGNKDSICVHTF
jgi:hypothetical protein